MFSAILLYLFLISFSSHIYSLDSSGESEIVEKTNSIVVPPFIDDPVELIDISNFSFPETNSDDQQIQPEIDNETEILDGNRVGLRFIILFRIRHRCENMWPEDGFGPFSRIRETFSRLFDPNNFFLLSLSLLGLLLLISLYNSAAGDNGEYTNTNVYPIDADKTISGNGYVLLKQTNS